MEVRAEGVTQRDGVRAESGDNGLNLMKRAWEQSCPLIQSVR